MYQIIVAASTHWDREWYRTFENFRIRLCDLLNNLLDLLEQDDDFFCYTFDGQSVVLEDYLEIFPHQKERLKRLVAQGKIVFGPLYNLPDEFLSSGEALIRNFLVGHQVCTAIGGKMNAGYIPDNFGHISQMPQILNGVGLKSAFFFRGCNIDTLGGKEFIWKAPDGSKVLAEYMLLGYWSLKSWGKLGLSPEEHFKAAVTTLGAKSKLQTILLINGSDHLYQDPEFTALLKKVQAAFPEWQIKNGSIEDYAQVALARAEKVDLPEIVGELRDFRYGPDPTATTSTRYKIKRAMYYALQEIERYTEPLNTIAYQKGQTYPGELLTYAWKKLLKALGHDAVAGCSIDNVMDDIARYIKEAHTIADRLTAIAFEKLTPYLSTEKLGENEQYLCLFNPLQFNSTTMVDAVIHVERAEEIADLALYDENRVAVPYEYLDQWEEVITREFKYLSKEKVPRKCFKIRFLAKDVPALGFKNYIVKPLAQIGKRQAELYIRCQNSERFIENEFYRVTPDLNGGVTVLDKQNNREYRELNNLISRGEIGDEYQHVSPLLDEHVFATLRSVSVIKNSPLSSTLKIRSILNIPKEADELFLGRHQEEVECPIVTYVTLYQGCPRIDFKVEVENKGRNHVLTVKFPTNFVHAADFSHIGFDEVTRDNQIYEFDPELKSTQSFLKPMQHYAGIRGDDGVLYVMTKGLYEYRTTVSAKGMDLYLTLLRSTSHLFRGIPISWLSGQHSTTPIVETEGSRELGKHTFEYALFFGQGEINEIWQQYAYPLRSFDLRKKEGADADALSGTSFIRMDNNAVLLSAMKKHEDSEGIVLRIFNTKAERATVTIDFGFNVSRCYYSDLLEKLAEEIAVQNNRVSLTLGPKKIQTLVVYC